jgi:hypothetical protein
MDQGCYLELDLVLILGCCFSAWPLVRSVSALVVDKPLNLPHIGCTMLRKPMLFMIIERFRDNDMIPIYKRVRDQGRMLPEGLKYIDSWIEPNFSRCFQLMECDDLRLLQEWTLQWRGSGATFEIVPVVSSKETREVVAPYLDLP